MSFSNLFGGRILQDSDNTPKPSSLVDRLLAPSTGVKVRSPVFNTFVEFCNSIALKILKRTFYTEAETPLKVEYKKNGKDRVVYVDKESLAKYLKRNPHPEANGTDETHAQWVKACLENKPTAQMEIPTPPPRTLTLEEQAAAFEQKFGVKVPPEYHEKPIPSFNPKDLSTEARDFIEKVVAMTENRASWNNRGKQQWPILGSGVEGFILAGWINAGFERKLPPKPQT